MAGSPGLIPKAALTTSRVIYFPFTIPLKLNESATLMGAAGHNLVGGVNKAVAESYMALQPRGPAKWLVPMFQKVNDSVVKSSAMAERNKKVFWDPFSNGVEQVGRAIASPGAYYYLAKAGAKDPGNPDLIKGILNMGLFKYPPGEQIQAAEAQMAAAKGGGGQPAAQQGPPPEAAQQAAEGAGQAQPAA